MYTYSLKSAKILFETAEEMGLKPIWLNEYGLFEIESESKKKYIFHSISLLNTQLSSQLSKHKHLTRIVLERHSLPNIPYFRSKKRQEIASFIREHKLVIAKPVLGSGSQDVLLIKHINDLSNISYEDYIFEKFIKGREMRYLFFQGKIISVHEKSYKGPLNDPKTVKRISYPKDKWDEKLVQLATQAANALALQFASVDFLIDDKNNPYILEINSAPGLYWFHNPTSGPSIGIAKMFLKATIEKITK